MKINRFAGLLALSTLGFAAMSPAAHAQTNGSFENPALTNPGDYTTNSIPDWTFTGNLQTYAYGVYRPTTTDFTTSIPDGVQAAYVSQGGAIYQDQATTLAAKTQYDLSFFVGSRERQPGAGTVYLETSGGNILAQTSLTPTAGTFVGDTLQFVAGTGNPYLGETLRIVLADASGSQVSFDNIKLTERIAPTSTAPEGSSILLLFGGMAPFGLGLLSRRRSRKS